MRDGLVPDGDRDGHDAARGQPHGHLALHRRDHLDGAQQAVRDQRHAQEHVQQRHDLQRRLPHVLQERRARMRAPRVRHEQEAPAALRRTALRAALVHAALCARRRLVARTGVHVGPRDRRDERLLHLPLVAHLLLAHGISIFNIADK